MRVRPRCLIACEASGIVRDAFARRGWDAWSCDLKPCERGGQHIQGDVRPHLRKRWNLVIAHPECTYITNSGVRWLMTDAARWRLCYEACEFFRECLDANAEAVVAENPIPHKYAAKWIGVKYSQVIQPWHHGHGECKATCLWVRGLPLLKPSNVVAGREQRVHRMAPGPNRKADRSRTLEGIAEAFASQWGNLTGSRDLFTTHQEIA